VTGPCFDVVVMVDWSAASTRRTGRDSIWVARGTRRGRVDTANWPTRSRAIEALEHTLDQALEEGRRVLLGFDLAFGYPEGFAACLAADGQPWEQVWRYFAERIVDGEDNGNNRFAVAAELNRCLGRALFWGCPKALPGLSPRLKLPPAGLGPNPFPALRRTDVLAGKGIRSVWQLYGGVTVGSQVLMGLPYLQGLRDRYRDRLVVWPQQTGFVHDPLDSFRGAQILLAEIWPTALRPSYAEGGVRDEQQVRWCVEQCFDQQENLGGLGRWFAAHSALNLAPDGRSTAAVDEGWILGVGSAA
jgi:hypothetical protein